MDGFLNGRVVIVTGAGRGLGREHALLLAAEGARVVVNDLGTSSGGDGHDETPARSVVEEIRAAGGSAVASIESVTGWDGAALIVQTALESFGDLHAVVNNAGVLRDRMLVSMPEADFDAVVATHLKGTAAMTHAAGEYWRAEAKSGRTADRAVVNTSSGAGLHGNVGQANYAAAKAGIAALTVVTSMEMASYGVRANAIAPIARTRLTEGVPLVGDVVRAPDEPGLFDAWHPANVSPLVAYLASASCDFTGQVFGVHGGDAVLYQGWSMAEKVSATGRWEVAELAEALGGLPRSVPVESQFAFLAEALS